MAGYRQFHTKFWTDEYIQELSPEEKLLFIYAFTAAESSIAGIYKVSLKTIEFDTGLPRDKINKILYKFSKDNKVHYLDGVMWVVNMRRHHKNASTNTMKKLQSDIDNIPDCEIKRRYQDKEKNGYIYPSDTPSIPIQKTALKLNIKHKLNHNNKDKDESEIEDKSSSTGGVFKAYESNIGILTKIVSDEIGIALKDTPPEWLIESFQISAKQNKRSWAYSKAILKRWHAEGKDNGGKPKNIQKWLDPDGNLVED